MVKNKQKVKEVKEKLPRTVSIFPYQTGRVKDIFADISRPALEPGKRKSKSGNYYWESRKNRSDVTGKRV